jgi:translation initiation factor IF-2
VHDTAPKSIPSFTSLLDQIAQQEVVLKQQSEEAAQKKAAGQGRSRRAESGRGSRHAAPAQGTAQPAAPGAAPSTDEASNGHKHGKKGRRGEGAGEDRYSRMAREAEAYSHTHPHSHVVEEARVAVEEASRESSGRRKRRKERRQQQAEEAAKEQRIEEALANDQDISQLDTVKVPQGATVSELAELLGAPANDIIKRLFLLGTPLTLTESMSDELIELVADDLGRDVNVMSKEEENSFTFYDDPADLVPRAPVVTVMGHVDHGKTSLLDAIRHTGVAEGEAGGITQAIGASQVSVKGRHITFIDTPGHETFTAMRARGAKVTDIVILIVAADDGVMPQTVESINHAKAAGVPIIVAVNKIDKPGANPDKVRQELTEYGVVPEEWGGQNMFANISAKKKIGIDDLLETVLLQADVLELKANPNTFASGNVLEARLDRGRGSVATMLVTRGTLHVGDAVVAGQAYGHVRAMLDPKGNSVTQAGPSDAVEILGLSSVPMAGDEFRVFQDDRDARDLADQRALKARIEEQNRVKHVTLENLFDTMADAEVKELNLIIKADVQGSIEALQDSLDKMDQSEVRINTIHSAVGAITETDVTLADASNAIIIGFGVRPEAKARAAAERDGVEIRSYSVIYKAIEDIDAARIGMLKPTEVEVQTGVAEVRDTFKVPKVGIAAGCMVSEGELSRDDSVRLVRDGIVVYEGRIASLRRFKDDVKSVKAGFECGIGLENFQDVKPGDQIEGYRIERVARTE